MQANRRKHPRLAINLKVAYRGGRYSGTGYTVDLGIDGMFLQITEPFEPGESLELQFQVNVGAERRPVVCQGKVIRALSLDQARSAGWPPGVGLKLQDFRQGFAELQGFLAERLGISIADLGEAPPARPAAPAAPDSSGPAARPVSSPASTVVSSGPAARPASSPVATAVRPGLASGHAPAPAARSAAKPPLSASRPATARGRSKLAVNVEEESDWKAQIRGEKSKELVDLIEQAKAQVADKPRSRWREVVGLAFRSAVIAICVSVLAYCLMHFRVIPWDLTTWEETVWMGFEESSAPQQASGPAPRGSSRTVQAANDFLAEQEMKLRQVKGPHDEKLREGGVDPDSLGIGAATGPGGRPLTELEKSRAGHDLRKKEMSALDQALPSQRAPKVSETP